MMSSSSIEILLVEFDVSASSSTSSSTSRSSSGSSVRVVSHLVASVSSVVVCVTVTDGAPREHRRRRSPSTEQVDCVTPVTDAHRSSGRSGAAATGLGATLGLESFELGSLGRHVRHRCATAWWPARSAISRCISSATRRYDGWPCGDDRSSSMCIASRALNCITYRIRYAIDTAYGACSG